MRDVLPRCLFSVLVAFLAVAPSPHAGEGPTVPAAPATADVYERAIREAEHELARAKEPTAAAASGGWGVGEVLSLVALLAAIALAVWATRWSRGLFPGKRGGAGEMRVLDRLAVGKSNTLVLIRLRGRDYWLSEGPGGVNVLGDWPAAAAEIPPPNEK